MALAVSAEKTCRLGSGDPLLGAWFAVMLDGLFCPFFLH